MNFSRLVFAFAAGWCLFAYAPLAAQETTPPFVMEKHYSADVAITLKNGMAISSKTYVDGDKLRSEAAMGGMAMELIVRKDTKKVYQILESQKMIMEMNFNPDKFKGKMAASFGPEGKFELIGPETVDEVACTKYKVTSTTGREVFYFWLDAARKIPVEMAALDGSLTVKWKNFVAGPQDAALFEPPTGYQVMTAPELPGAGGGAGGP